MDAERGGKAGHWVNNINGDLARISEALADLEVAGGKGMSRTMVVAWETTLQGHSDELREVRGRLEKLRDGGNNDGVIECCAETVEAMNRDLKACQVSLKGFKKQ